MDIETYEWNVTRNMLDSGALKWVSFSLPPPPHTHHLFLARPAPAVLFEPRKTDVKFPSAENPQPSSVLSYKAWSVSEYKLAYFNSPLLPGRNSTFPILTCIDWIRFFVGPFAYMDVPADSPSRGGDVAVYVFDISQRSFSTSFYSVLVSFSVFMALSAVFHCVHSINKSLLSHSVLLVSFLPF